MSVTVTDILKLPCLKGARVAGGRGGLNKVLSSVSVLEFADPNDLQRELLSQIEFYGSEIVITAFASIADNVEKQCDNIRRLADVGEVGIILYYVGVLMPRVDEALVRLADQLDFVLIVMPEGRMDLRYSEVITEVMEAIIHDQAADVTLVSDVLAQISRLPEFQRTVDTVLCMVRDRLRCSLILADRSKRTLGMAAWPMSLQLRLEDLPPAAALTPQSLPGERVLWRCPLEAQNAQSMELYLIKDGAPLPRETVLQAVDVVRLAVNLWSSHHDDVQISELVRAILRDEPMKMRRLAELFRIDVASMHAMWILRSAEEGALDRGALPLLREALAARGKTVVADEYEGCAVAFMDWSGQEETVRQVEEGLLAQLEEAGIPVILTCCDQLQNTADVRRAFLLHQAHLGDARKIWPSLRRCTGAELAYAARCRQIVDAGEGSVQAALAPLSPLDNSKEGGELRRTLAAYLLDAGSSVARTASLLYLHKNTVKYRMGRIGSLLGHHVEKEPEKFSLYQASAIWRLLDA